MLQTLTPRPALPGAPFSGPESIGAVPGAPGGGELPLLLKYWRILVRWRWVIGGIILSALVIGIVATLLTTPKYTATSTIEISRQQDKIVNVEDVQPESGAVDLEFYQTQYSLLQARSLAERVVADLKLGENDRFFEMFGEEVGNEGLFADSSLKRVTAAERVERARRAADILLDNVGIDPIRGSRLVRVSFTSPDPGLSQQVANAWTKHFIELNLARRFEATAYARNFLEGRLEQLRRRLEESERQLVGYASNQRIINLPGSGGSEGQASVERPLIADDLVALNAALATATADRVRAESRLREAGDSRGAVAEALQNDAISQLRQKRAEVAAEHARLLTQFEPGYPAVVALATQLNELDRAISREVGRVSASIRNAYEEAVAREDTLRARVDALKAGLLDLRRRSIQYNIYQREVDTNRQLYDGLLQRYKEIGVAGGVGTNNVSIVDAAQLPREPSAPSLALNLLLSLLAGVGIAVLVTLALEQIDEAVKDPSEVSRATGMPLLGTIPQLEEGTPVEQLLDRKSAMSEAYLSLQTNLQFSTDHGVPRSLAVTSTRAGEGKSTTSYAIAQSLARTGRKVALIDADMRSPSVHHMVGLANARGVSNFLSGDDAVGDLITPIADLNIAAITAGPQPPNAAELLTGPRLELLLAKLTEMFDHVVIDSPPVLGLADAPLIASRAEGVVYAVQSQGARASMIRAALSRLQSANANILGVVLTKFEARKAHYGYGYDYGYGYGEQDKHARA